MAKDMSAKYRMSFRRVAKLLQIFRSSLYYKPKGESKENLKLMELIDQKYPEVHRRFHIQSQKNEGVSP